MKKKYILPLLLLVQIIIINILSLFPQFVERYYSNGLFPVISKGERLLFGLFRFSIGDLIYGIVLFFAVRWLWKTRKTWKKQYADNGLKILSAFSVFYFLFHLLWAMNYHRIPLNEKMGFDKQYTTEELVAFTKKIIAKTNAMHRQIEKNDSLKVVVPYTVQEIYVKSIDGYSEMEQQFPYFAFKHESIKSSLMSVPLSYMGFGGYLNPFTNEAQVNNKLPRYGFPATACHEMSHQIGYASESEANFIGYMAATHNKDLYFKYAGYTMALKYCLRNINKLDEKKAKSLAKLVLPGIKANFKESEEFNKKYKSFVETIFEYFYDNYLKLNKQEDGLETYSKFVGLLINYYKDKEL
ncbi:DUF3810 domain-containing protein [Flavobacterium sp. DG1-102-2]|uniref:DUF3810 domain-containing protein n=1 Tax=Flavobacterium sp. DG1-102-2 TaxID=3081663 RepID=UPI00294A3E77|nr:DUF3810 domain-containing protein [Flavobacterium sp. DG1-102-2]MDV6170388.1 DUF3810 domain-containing protein [Flavobacterium sp. DG1-102-2]